MLSGYRVIDFTCGGVSLGGQMLSDLGAEVILVEPPGGNSDRRTAPFRDGVPGLENSLTFWSLNRGKRSVVLDLDSDAGQASARQLAASADFVLESFPPGYLAERGLGYERLASLRPSLVMVSVTPFGQTGPKAKWAATDITSWAASGALAMTGDDDRAPVGVAVPQAFLHAGAEAAVGALIAHAGRQRDGRGQQVDVSIQTASMMAGQATVLSAGWKSQPTLRMAGGVKFGGIPLKFVNPAKDGYVSVTFLFGSAIGPFTRRLMEVMCEEGFVDEATRDKDWINYTGLILSGQEPLSELMRCIAAISEFTSSHTKEELLRMGMERGLLIVPVARIDEVVHSPQLASRHFWTTVEHPEADLKVTYPGPFAKVSGAPVFGGRRPPMLGEHTREVLEGLPPLPAPSSLPNAPRPLPLAGLKVVEFSWVVAAPWGVRYLADYGATVVKVENPARVDTARTVGPFLNGVPHPENSAAYATVNTGKLGLSLNLGTPEGKALALKLCTWADVVVESFSPGAIARLGLGYEDIRKQNPGVIMLSSCLNGQTGPQAGLAGFGTMGAQIAGFGDLAGWPDRAPAGPAGAYTDYIAPKFTASVILAALDERSRTGVGQYIDLSQAEASAHFLAPAVLDYTVNGKVMSRNGNRSPDYAPHGVYPAAGTDRWVAIAAPTGDAWRGLARAAGQGWEADPRFGSNEDRLAHADELDAAIAAWSAGFEVGELEDRLQAEGVAAHRASLSEDCMSDPQLVHRGHFPLVEHPTHGPVPVEASRMVFSATPAVATRPGPTFGQDNETVLREILGMDDDAIGDLVAAGALA